MDYFVYHTADDIEVKQNNSTGLYKTTRRYKMPGDNKRSTEDTYIIKPIRMLNTLYKTLDLDIMMDFSKPLDKKTDNQQFYLTPRSPGPFPEMSSDKLRAYIQSLVEMRLDFGFSTIFIKREYPEILLWQVSLTFDFTNRGGKVPLLAKFDVSLCETNRDRSKFNLNSFLACI
jgi:hypothetical protein